jgi:hypothetical protein
MHYLVVVDARSAVARIHMAGNNAGTVPDGELHHPVLDCLEVATDSPHYLFVKRKMPNTAVPQLIHIPHGAVVAIYPYGVDAEPPFGFMPPSAKARA